MKTGLLLYIDPGTGAMLFTVIMGVVTTLMFALQKFWLKLRFILSGGKAASGSGEKMGIVIFSDSRRYWNVFKPICDEFERRGQKCCYWTASPDDPALAENYKYVKCEFIGEGNKAFARVNLMSADICLSTTPGIDVYQWKRSKNAGCYVHIPHDVGEMTGYRMFGIDYYDAILLTGEFQKEDIRQLEQIRGLKEKELLVVGSPYMDALMEKLNNNALSKHDGITVLVAPSWGESSILNRYGERFLEYLRNTGYKIIIRPHPQSKISDEKMLDTLQKKYPDSDDWQWNFDNDNFDVLNEADILISDFSAVMFDFALVFGKPIIYADTHMDRSPYDSCWLEKEPWRWSVLPKIGRQLKEEDFGRIKEVVDETINNNDYGTGRIETQNAAWQYRGESAKRIVDYLIEKQSKLVRGLNNG